MNTLTLFILEMLICITISAGIIKLFKPVLKNILIETCRAENRADFWVMFTQLMLVISPLLIVIYFAPSEVIDQSNLTAMLKATLFQSLLGIFIALLIVAKIIWSSIQSFTEEPLAELHLPDEER